MQTPPRYFMTCKCVARIRKHEGSLVQLVYHLMHSVAPLWNTEPRQRAHSVLRMTYLVWIGHGGFHIHESAALNANPVLKFLVQD